MDSIIADFGAALLGALVGGGLSAWGAVWSAAKAVRMASEDLESSEIRRQKVACISSLSGARFSLSQVAVPPEYKAIMVSN